MADGSNVPTTIPPVAVVNIVLFTHIFNIIILAVSFAVLAGVADFFGRPFFARLFASGAGFLMLLSAFLGVLRSALVRLIEDLVF